MNHVLPASPHVDVAVLGRLFKYTTNSYKYLFVRALLDLLSRQANHPQKVIFTLQEIAVEMVVSAWYPHTFFHLSFGAQDQIGRIMEGLTVNGSTLPGSQGRDPVQLQCRTLDSFGAQDQTGRIMEGLTVNGSALPGSQGRDPVQLRCHILDHGDLSGLKKLLRFVPYRILRPFFENELTGEKDHKVNDRIHALASASFDADRPPLYRFVDAGEPAIQLHPLWAQYLLNSFTVVQGWLDHHWVLYLQSRNPNTPAIPNKISPPLRRASLQAQKAYWKSVISTRSVRCIYSHRILEPDSFALDHFIPWTFVCHDQLWNLVPVIAQANSSKSNRLPAQQYLEPFIELQALGLHVSHQEQNHLRWIKATESFMSDLRLESSDLLDAVKIRDAYEAVLPSMISLAGRAGFSADWRYTDRTNGFGMEPV